MAEAAEAEAYRSVPMPPGVKVARSELDGPVFTDATGKTLYHWPLRELRNGIAGDHAGASECNDTPLQVTAGLMSPYPAGLYLPDLDHHLSCTQMWPPFLAEVHAKPIGKWTLVERRDGKHQWAFDGLPVYTFFLDRQTGDVLGAKIRQTRTRFTRLATARRASARCAAGVRRQDHEYRAAIGHGGRLLRLLLRWRQRDTIEL